MFGASQLYLPCAVHWSKQPKLLWRRVMALRKPCVYPVPWGSMASPTNSTSAHAQAYSSRHFPGKTQTQERLKSFSPQNGDLRFEVESRVDQSAGRRAKHSATNDTQGALCHLPFKPARMTMRVNKGTPGSPARPETCQTLGSAQVHPKLPVEKKRRIPGPTSVSSLRELVRCFSRSTRPSGNDLASLWIPLKSRKGFPALGDNHLE